MKEQRQAMNWASYEERMNWNYHGDKSEIACKTATVIKKVKVRMEKVSWKPQNNILGNVVGSTLKTIEEWIFGWSYFWENLETFTSELCLGSRLNRQFYVLKLLKIEEKFKF